MGKLLAYRKRKIILTIITSLTILFGAIYFITFVYGAYIHVENYSVREIIVEKDNLIFKGNTVSSAQAFSGYKYKIKDDSVYLKIRYSLVSRFNQSGKSNIDIKDNFENVKNVYLQGINEDDIRLIWSK